MVAIGRPLERASRPRRSASPTRGLGGQALTGDRAIVVTGSVVVALAVAGFFAVGSLIGPDVWVPLLLVAFLTAISIPLCSAMAGRPMDRRLRKILVVAFALKMLCTFPRYVMNEVAYEGNADAGLYHEGGRQLRANVAEGSYSLDGSFLQSFASETRFVGFVNGTLYLVTGASQMAGYLFFTWMSWLGLLCVFRAFRVAYPNAPPYLAAGLIFFLPSTLYWPSSIGKDALMVLGIGLVTLGAARLMTGSRALLGAAWFSAGALLIVNIRAHLLLIALAGCAASLIVRNASDARTRHAVIGRAVLLVALVPALFLGLSRMDDMFGSTQDAGSFSVTSALEKASGQTSVGGSAFETQPVTSPLDLPLAAGNVLFRPFLFEARNAASLISALEGTALLVLALASSRWLWRMGPAMYRNPLAAFCGGFVLSFVFAFSNIGNAGILARQRVQMFPVLMVLVAAAAEQYRLHRLTGTGSALAAAEEAPMQDAVAPRPTPEPRLVLVP